jgi:MoaA/NifB/PqqE/SkfB family radical SAM enzyme
MSTVHLTGPRAATPDTASHTRFMWLEITGNCQLECAHCYASSGPGRGHGTMSPSDWLDVITDAAACGVQQVQFIGGEPTAHPALGAFIAHARSHCIDVEVFSNLFVITKRMWQLFEDNEVSLATSYYSAIPAEHDGITGRRGSYLRTRANIVETLRRGLPLRVGVIRLNDHQHVSEAIDELQQLGVPESAIGTDDLRQVGRGEQSHIDKPEEQLCGRCADGVAAVMPDGTVQPCVFARDTRFHVGNTTASGLAPILAGPTLDEVRTHLNGVFTVRQGFDCPPLCPPILGGPPPTGPCLPECWPGCPPNCGPVCSPACPPRPSGGG